MRKQSDKTGIRRPHVPQIARLENLSATVFCLESLCSITGVDPRTARRWQTGAQQIGPVALRLLNLFAHGRVLPDTPDWRDWRIAGGRLQWSADYALTGDDLRAHYYERQTLATLRAELAAARAHISYLESLTPRAPVVPLASTPHAKGLYP
jgi:hypothetical protein